MGTGISSTEGDKNIIHIDVIPGANNVDNINRISSQTTLHCDYITKEQTNALGRSSSKTGSTKLDTSSINGVDSMMDGYADCLRDVPFRVSEKYYLPSLADVNLTSVSPINLINFQYDFHTERACINSPMS